MRQTITQVRTQATQDIELIIAGDFNRHDQLWGGDHIGSSPRQGEAADIINFMRDLDLQSLLPRGTITYESTMGNSTIDLIFTTERLTDELLRCNVHPNEYGSDHRGIESIFNVEVEHSPPRTRLLFENALWAKISQDVRDNLNRRPPLATDNLNTFAEKLLDPITNAVNQHVP